MLPESTSQVMHLHADHGGGVVGGRLCGYIERERGDKVRECGERWCLQHPRPNHYLRLTLDFPPLI